MALEGIAKLSLTGLRNEPFEIPPGCSIEGDVADAKPVAAG